MNPFDPGYFETEALRGFGFAHVGPNCRVARNCTIIGLARIHLAGDLRIDGPTTIVVGPSATLRIGRFVHLGGGCHISAAADVSLGDFAGLSQGVRIYAATDDYSGRSLTNPMVPAALKAVRAQPVHIGRHVIIGAGSVVLPGSDIGEGCAVGALSLVNRPLPAWGIHAGTPVRLIGPRAQDLLRGEDELLRSLGAAPAKQD